MEDGPLAELKAEIEADRLRRLEHERPRNREKYLRRKADAEAHARDLQYQRDYKRTEASRKREAALQRSRALTKQEQEAGRPKPNTCEVCSSRGRIVFDHCHRTGVFRGWICSHCNLILGRIKDDPMILEKLVVYLRTHNAS